ncbi:MAG TPA: 3-methyl-2-oxobutanoate hydroxymethyltransferase, partial [Rhodocyclaceae bacterium]|nr:3-methyl-2-oxobutanoate hydroxymethyltransferase [Rhodocyclaceae bacterium]
MLTLSWLWHSVERENTEAGMVSFRASAVHAEAPICTALKPWLIGARGPTVPETIDYMVKRGIPVMGHVGLRPQAVLVDGGFKAKGRTDDERARILAE